MLVYLAGDEDRIEELDTAREYLGWTDILAKEDDLDLTSQRNQAAERQAKADQTVTSVCCAYQWALVPANRSSPF